MKKIKKSKKGLQRYFGYVEIPKGEKHCWLSHEDKRGWSLGFALPTRTVWLRGLRFINKKEVEKAIGCSVVFVHVKGSDK